MPDYTRLAKVIRARAEKIRDCDDMTPEKLDEAELYRALARMVEGKSVHQAFGAPGGWGYGTEIGMALKACYQQAGRTGTNHQHKERPMLCPTCSEPTRPQSVTVDWCPRCGTVVQNVVELVHVPQFIEGWRKFFGDAHVYPASFWLDMERYGISQCAGIAPSISVPAKQPA